MSIGAIFTHRVRGVRLVEVWAIGLLFVLVFGVYLTKTFAGREASEITKTQNQIEEEQTRIRLLKAEVAYLEQPERIERLSQLYLRLAPMSGKRETDAEGLADIIHRPAPPAPVVPVTTDPAAEPALPAAPAGATTLAMSVVTTPAVPAGGPR